MYNVYTTCILCANVFCRTGTGADIFPENKPCTVHRVRST